MEIKSKPAAYCDENIVCNINFTSVRSASSSFAHTTQKNAKKNWPLNERKSNIFVHTFLLY